MKVEYEYFTNGWIKFSKVLEDLASLPTVNKICEVGGGANPSLTLEFVERHEIEYTLLDISAEELEKAPDSYKKVQADITSPTLSLAGGYDLVFSMFLAEHVKSGRNFHRNVLNLLNEGGHAFHFFPTLYALPFIVNRVLPQDLSNIFLLSHDDSRKKEGKHGKFPAYYDWCTGPLKIQTKRLEDLGYSIEEYVGFFGHDYYRKLKPVQTLSNIITSVVLKYPTPLLTAYAYVLLRKSRLC